MSRFFVGQRVRILWSRGWPELAGQLGAIVARSPTKGVEGISEWRVAPDVWGSHEAPRRGDNGASLFAPNSNQLEPIQDPGREVVSWSECLWKPEGVTA